MATKHLVERKLRSELYMRGMTYKQLAAELNEKAGIEETDSSLRNKFYRGTVSATLMLNIFWVLGMYHISTAEWLGKRNW